MELELIVVDFGDSCAVVVKSGWLSLEPFCLPGDEVRALVPRMNAHVIGHPFDEVKVAIDSLFNAPPPVFPRIERTGDTYHFRITDYSHPILISENEKNILLKFDVPIHDPNASRTHWQQLNTPAPYQNARTEREEVGFGVWRFRV